MTKVPPGKKQLLGRIERGDATSKALLDAGATQVSAMPEGTCSGVSYPATFANDGTWTQPLYAVSIAGVLSGDVL